MQAPWPGQGDPSPPPLQEEDACGTIADLNAFLLAKFDEFDARLAALELLPANLGALHALAQQHSRTIAKLQSENAKLEYSMTLMQLGAVNAKTKPISVLQSPEWEGNSRANLLSVVRMEGFQSLISRFVTPCSGNVRFAGKVGWAKLQKTCSALRTAPVSIELDPAVRLVPDNFPTIRRAVQNVDKNSAHDRGRIVVRQRAEPYVESIVVDRRVSIIGDSSSGVMPVVWGRICVDEAAGGTEIYGLAVRNINPRDQWGSAVEVSRALDVLIDSCDVHSKATDEAVLSLRDCGTAVVRNTKICAENSVGAVGISVSGCTKVFLGANVVVDSEVGLRIQPTARAHVVGNLFARQKSSILLCEGSEAFAELLGNLGHVVLQQNRYEEIHDGRLSDEASRDSLEAQLLDVAGDPCLVPPDSAFATVGVGETSEHGLPATAESQAPVPAEL